MVSLPMGLVSSFSWFQPLILVCSLSVVVLAQSHCANYGQPNPNNASACLCPSGFGGPSCSSAACGGDIFQGVHRSLASNGNVTSPGCACESGWIGTGCNVCQTSSACQGAFSASGAAASNVSSITSTGAGEGLNNATVVCNTEARVYAASQMSCEVLNPTLQSLYPLSTALNIIRTLQPGFSPIPNTTSYGSEGSVFASLFYSGIEQFSCTAGNCTQTLSSTATKWDCQNLKCACIANTTFCGGGGIVDISGT
ncbi:unnamed protein product, partial [Mycena citricolor]